MTRQFKPSAAPRLELPAIECELSRPGFHLRFLDSTLESQYAEELREGSRVYNRVCICVLVAIFDSYIIQERIGLPEAVSVSAWLRFGLLTPLTLVYVLLDWRGLFRRWNAQMVSALLVAPTLLGCIESLWVHSPLALGNYQALPLLQLTVLTCRLGIRQSAFINMCACLMFSAAMLRAPFLQASQSQLLVTTDWAIGIATVAFAWRLDARDRRVFLLTHQATIGRDILARQNRKLAQLSQVDALTGLGNRRCFDDAVAALWSPGLQSSWPVSLILLDIDCFKQFNDLLGHQAGDECLATLARTMRGCLRDPRDTIVRYGGEEFALLLPATQLGEAAAVAERVRLAVLDRALPHPGGGTMKLVTISLGVATATASSQSPASLIEAADRALYVAKRQGRNRVACDGDATEAPPAAGPRLVFTSQRREAG